MNLNREKAANEIRELIKKLSPIQGDDQSIVYEFSDTLAKMESLAIRLDKPKVKKIKTKESFTIQSCNVSKQS